MGGLLFLATAQAALAGDFYKQTNLITSATDPDLINPWGISFGATSPFWVSDNGTGKSTLYNTAGVKQGLIVTHAQPRPDHRAGLQWVRELQWQRLHLRQRGRHHRWLAGRLGRMRSRCSP